LGEVLADGKPGRTSDEQITIYKAMGHAIEDQVATEIVLGGIDLLEESVTVEL